MVHYRIPTFKCSFNYIFQLPTGSVSYTSSIFYKMYLCLNNNKSIIGTYVCAYVCFVFRGSVIYDVVYCTRYLYMLSNTNQLIKSCGLPELLIIETYYNNTYWSWPLLWLYIAPLNHEPRRVIAFSCTANRYNLKLNWSPDF